MTVNPYLYTKRHNTKLKLECPTMTFERYMKGYDTKELLNEYKRTGKITI